MTRYARRTFSSYEGPSERARLTATDTAVVSRIQHATSVQVSRVLAAVRPQAGFTSCATPMTPELHGSQ